MRAAMVRAAGSRCPLVKVGLLAVLVAGLAGCGVRGNLETPAADKAADTTATADSGQGKAEGAALKPQKPFILDPLLR